MSVTLEGYPKDITYPNKRFSDVIKKEGKVKYIEQHECNKKIRVRSR